MGHLEVGDGAESALRARAGRGLRRAGGVWRAREAALQVRDALGFRPGAGRVASVLGDDMRAAALAHRTRLIIPACEIDLVANSLKHFAGRRARRARAVALGVLVAAVAALGARDGNANGRADVLDLAVAAWGISGFGASVPGETAKRTVAPNSVGRG